MSRPAKARHQRITRRATHRRHAHQGPEISRRALPLHVRRMSVEAQRLWIKGLA